MSALAALPRPLWFILAAAVPIFVVCFLLSGLRDQRIEAGQASPAAMQARLQPVAHVEFAMGKVIGAAARDDSRPLAAASPRAGRNQEP